MPTITVDAEDARMIDRAFLPLNPNKCRSAHPDVVDAVRRFKAALASVPSLGFRVAEPARREP